MSEPQIQNKIPKYQWKTLEDKIEWFNKEINQLIEERKEIRYNEATDFSSKLEVVCTDLSCDEDGRELRDVWVSFYQTTNDNIAFQCHPYTNFSVTDPITVNNICINNKTKELKFYIQDIRKQQEKAFQEQKDIMLN